MEITNPFTWGFSFYQTDANGLEIKKKKKKTQKFQGLIRGHLSEWGMIFTNKQKPRSLRCGLPYPIGLPESRLLLHNLRLAVAVLGKACRATIRPILASDPPKNVVNSVNFNNVECVFGTHLKPKHKPP